MKPRQRFSAAVEGQRIDRLPFVPLAFGVCAKVQGVSYREMLTNATVLANSVVAGQKYFKYDAIVTYLDATLLPEALGLGKALSTESLQEALAEVGQNPSAILQRGRLPVMLEGVQRVSTLVKRDGILLLSPIDGPASLSASLETRLGAEGAVKLAGDILCALVSALCEAGSGAILLMEDEWPAEEEKAESLSAALSTLRNVTCYYEAKLILMLKQYAADRASGLDVDGLLVPAASWPQEPAASAFGVGLDNEIFEHDVVLPSYLVSEETPADDGVRFVSTMSDVPGEGESINRLLDISRRLGCHD
ncbi:MAG: hypothetical protein M5U22_01935 [Thermoleophilia bacterium]|nr:hypothetical protein [Thermoleophilia bacterium]